MVPSVRCCYECGIEICIDVLEPPLQIGQYQEQLTSCTDISSRSTSPAMSRMNMSMPLSIASFRASGCPLGVASRFRNVGQIPVTHPVHLILVGFLLVVLILATKSRPPKKCLLPLAEIAAGRQTSPRRAAPPTSVSLRAKIPPRTPRLIKTAEGRNKRPEWPVRGLGGA
jgi:hypothetical protein